MKREYMGQSETWIIGDSEKIAFILLHGHTRGCFDVWDLAGPACAKTRQQIASLLEGKKVPVSKCGVTALRDAFYRIARLNGCPLSGTLATQQNAFADYATYIINREG